MTLKRLIGPFISAALTLINPGLGQLRNGQPLKAILFYSVWYIISFFLIWLELYRTFQGLILILSVIVILYAYFIIDAVIIALKTKTAVKKAYNKWIIYLLIILVNVIIASAYKDYINKNYMTAHHVPTVSMEPTLLKGDYFIGDYRYYTRNAVKPGDAIIIKFPKDTMLKYIERCIALGGQTVVITDKSVYIDEHRFQDSLNVQFMDTTVYSEKHLDPDIYPPYAGNRDNYGPVRVPENHCFVLGDNRDNSYDSRYWGFVPLKYVIAKPLYIYWSDDVNRIGKTIE